MRRLILPALILVLVLGLAAGCMKTTETTTYVDKDGRALKVVTTEGSVEGLAAMGQKQLAAKAIPELHKLVSGVEIPRGLDKEGKQLPPAKVTFVDSGLYLALAKMMDLSGYESPEVKGLKEVGSVVKRAAGPFFMWLIGDSASKNGGTHTNNYKDSFNNNRQSPVSMHNGHASSQSLTATNTEDYSSEDSSDHSSSTGEQ